MTRSARSLALFAILALATAACGGTLDTGFPDPDATPTAAPSPTGTGGGSVEVEVGDNFFGPAPHEITVKAGQTVRWEQTGAAPHSVTASDTTLFDSHPTCLTDVASCMALGDSFEHTFETPGRIGYYCVIHGTAPTGGSIPAGNMSGYVIVEG